MSDNPIIILNNGIVIYASYDSEKIFGHYSFLLKGKSFKDLIEKTNFDKLQKMKFSVPTKFTLIGTNGSHYNVNIVKNILEDKYEILIIMFEIPDFFEKKINNTNIDSHTYFEYFLISSKTEFSEMIADISQTSNNKHELFNMINKKSFEFYEELVSFLFKNEKIYFGIFNIEPVIRDIIDIIYVKNSYKSNITLINSLEIGNVYGNKNKFIDLFNEVLSQYKNYDSVNINLIEEANEAIIKITYSSDKNLCKPEFTLDDEYLAKLAKDAGATLFTYFDFHKGFKTVISYNLSRTYRLYENQ